MKKLSKTLLASSLFLIGTTLSHAAGNLGQGSGEVQFHGNIIDAPCSIVSDDPILVEFNQISNRVLADGGKSHVEPFKIQLADCDIEDLTAGNVAVTFSFTGASTSGVGVNLVGFDGLAAGAGVAIVSGGVTAINGAPLPVQKLQTGPNTLEFSSYVQGLGGALSTIQLGEFYANANFNLNYN